MTRREPINTNKWPCFAATIINKPGSAIDGEKGMMRKEWVGFKALRIMTPTCRILALMRALPTGILKPLQNNVLTIIRLYRLKKEALYHKLMGVFFLWYYVLFCFFLFFWLFFCLLLFSFSFLLSQLPQEAVMCFSESGDPNLSNVPPVVRGTKPSHI